MMAGPLCVIENSAPTRSSPLSIQCSRSSVRSYNQRTMMIATEQCRKRQQ